MTNRSAIEVRRVVAEAFVDDPLLQWMFPDPNHRLDSTAAWLGVFVDGYVEHGRVDVVGHPNPVAVAVWRMPGDTVELPELPSAWGLLAALTNAEHASRVGQGFRVLRELMPTEPFAYLQFLAVLPDHQGQGLGSKALQPGLDHADSLGAGTYLETTNPANLGFYRAHGFEVADEVTMEGGGPLLWTMQRPPAN